MTAPGFDEALVARIRAAVAAAISEQAAAALDRKSVV